MLRILRPKSGLYVVNESKRVSDADVKAWTDACATQITQHVAPAYGRKPVKVAFLPAATHAPAGAWVIAVLDNPDQAGALGYHSVDDAGRVYGRVFVDPCLQYNVPVSTTLSHEVVETYCDPGVDMWRDSGQGFSVAYEACDPVEGDSYQIGDVAVSDFVCPGWYRSGTPTGRLHWLDNGSITEPFQLASGGYYVRRLPNGSEDQVFGSAANRAYIAAKHHPLGRATRRMPKVTGARPPKR
jgi:hypothetical protein